MREITMIVIHCSATKSTKDFTAHDIEVAHQIMGFERGGYHYYIRKSGLVEKMRPEWMIGAHAKGFNARSIAVCYEGGLNELGLPADTRTLKQVIAMHDLVRQLWTRYPKARVVGHRDLSPDRNRNGRVDPWERIKACPCFDAIPEFERLR